MIGFRRTQIEKLHHIFFAMLETASFYLTLFRNDSKLKMMGQDYSLAKRNSNDYDMIRQRTVDKGFYIITNYATATVFYKDLPPHELRKKTPGHEKEEQEPILAIRCASRRFFNRRNGPTDGRTDGWTDGRTDGHTHL